MGFGLGFEASCACVVVVEEEALAGSLGFGPFLGLGLGLGLGFEGSCACVVSSRVVEEEGLALCERRWDPQPHPQPRGWW